MNLLIWLRQLSDVPLDENKNVHTTRAFDYSREIAIVKAPIHVGKVGRIKLHGVYWFARSHSCRTIKVGEDVEVLDREGLTLTVEPLFA